jgi:hypothetical protein
MGFLISNKLKNYLFNSVLTMLAIVLPSAFPANSFEVNPITLPISAGPEAPTFKII